ncbi:MAG: hypothetical protein A2X86_08850 [Bdellovibrionales bacterium GWA2_49_15]|nr:MAG: hypothetical protein A2X86_08850 [Bdellovibrionales bacterium GWA2_49_15]
MPTFNKKGLTSNLLLCSVFTLISLVSHAHTSRPPTTVVAPVVGSEEENRAGYGWLNTSSEVEADSLFRQECPRPNAAGEISICIPRNSSLEAAYTLAGQNFEAAFTNLALDNAYEQLILQRAAISPASHTWALPSCVANSPRARQMKADIDSFKGFNDVDLETQIENLQNQMDLITAVAPASRTTAQRRLLESLQRRRLSAVKLRATRQSFDTKRMGEAFLLDKQLAAAQSRTCPPDTNPGIPRKCMSIRRNRDRMRLAFPSVFAGGLAEQENITSADDRRRWEEKTFASHMENAVRCGTTPYNRFETSLYRLMGYNGTATPIPGAGTGPGTGSGACAVSDQDAAAIQRGQNSVTSAFADDSGYPVIVTDEDANPSDGNPDGVYNAAYLNGLLAPADPRMGTAFAALTTATNEMKSVQEMNAALSMTTFCQDRRSLADINRLQPQAMRQAVLDQNNDRSREAMTRLLCQKKLMAQFQSDDQTLDCSGVTGDPNGSGTGAMRVQRVNYGFPFVSDSNYTLKTLPDGTTEISTKINYRFIFDPSISPGSAGYLGNANVPAANRKTRAQQLAEFNTNTASWVQKSTDFLNASATTIADPKVKFKIERCTGCPAATEPKVEVSECYNRGGEPEHFATDFPGKTWDAHKCWWKKVMTPVPNPAGGLPINTLVPRKMYGNWQDAGGFTTTMDDATIMHETGHNLGLADEYVADYYPAHPVGENGATGCNNSTMAANSAACNVLYRRHLLEMVRPSRVCPKAAAVPKTP